MKIAIEIKNKYEEKAVLQALHDQQFKWLDGDELLHYSPYFVVDAPSYFLDVTCKANGVKFSTNSHWFEQNGFKFISFAEFFEIYIFEIVAVKNPKEKIERCLDELIDSLKTIKEHLNDK